MQNLTKIRCKIARRLQLTSIGPIGFLRRIRRKIIGPANTKIGIYVASYNSSLFLDMHLSAIKNCTIDAFDYYLLKNATSKAESLEFDRIVGRYPFVRVFDGVSKIANCSLRHGEALQKMVTATDNEIIVVMDVDAIVLKKGWDKWIVEKLRAKDAVGVLAHFEGRNAFGGLPLVLHPSFMAFSRKLIEANKLTLSEGEGNDPCYQVTKCLMKLGRFRSSFVEAIKPSHCDFPNGAYSNHPDFEIVGGVSHGFCTTYGDLLFHFWHSMNFKDKADILSSDGKILVPYEIAFDRLELYRRAFGFNV